MIAAEGGGGALTGGGAPGGGGAPTALGRAAAGGGALYWSLFRYYRNTDKSHSFETETRVAAQPITGNDRKIDEVKGTRRTSVDGDNHANHRQRVQRFNR